MTAATDTAPRVATRVQQAPSSPEPPMPPKPASPATTASGVGAARPGPVSLEASQGTSWWKSLLRLLGIEKR